MTGARGSGPAWAALTLLAPLFLATPRAEADESPGPPARLGVEQLVEGLSGFARHFDPTVSNYYVLFKEECEALDASGSVDPAKGYWTEYEVARKNGMAFVHKVLKMAAEDSVEEEYIAWRDGITAKKRRDGVTLLPNLMPECFNTCPYTQSLFVDCYRDMKFTSPTHQTDPEIEGPSDEMFYTLPRIVVENRAKYRVRPALELVDGHPCHVLEWPGRDVVWVDDQRGFVPLRRKFSLDEKHPAHEWFNRDLVRQSPGFWVPMSQVNNRYVFPDYPLDERPNSVKRRYTTRVLKIDFTERPDEFFQVPVAKDERVLVSDQVRGLTYIRHPDGSDPLKGVLEDLRYQGQHRPGGSPLFLLVNGVILAAIALGVVLHRQRKRAA